MSNKTTESNCNPQPELARPELPAMEVERLRAALQDIAAMPEHYNYVSWQRIVGQMRTRAEEALRSPNAPGERLPGRPKT